jgi:hypothetical protein
MFADLSSKLPDQVRYVFPTTVFDFLCNTVKSFNKISDDEVDVIFEVFTSHGSFLSFGLWEITVKQQTYIAGVRACQRASRRDSFFYY